MHGMKVDGDGERLNALPEWQVSRIVQVNAAAMAVDKGTLEAELAHASLELAGGGIRFLHRQMCKSRVARRVLLDLGGEKVVDPARLAHRPGTVALDLHARRNQRQHRDLDPGFVHGGDAVLGKIRKTRGNRAQEPRLEEIGTGPGSVGKAVGPEVLLERDFSHYC